MWRCSAALAEETLRAICEGADHDAPGVQVRSQSPLNCKHPYETPVELYGASAPRSLGTRVCVCGGGGLQLAAVKAALTAATSDSFVLNGEALLRAVHRPGHPVFCSSPP
jgi:hypothetical protein